MDLKQLEDPIHEITKIFSLNTAKTVIRKPIKRRKKIEKRKGL